ncbi:hypothetical protein AVEN_217774-1 [Araneus ventricosus]|uniref:Uncharacterized protein n=1 Tax=Araneus ventricosus TaxID=182803 RepID=A0A4Y2TPU2_ARAVE|nr:hypothetical protein AVEN_217774-1 [Araneus ventricosus]
MEPMRRELMMKPITSFLKCCSGPGQRKVRAVSGINGSMREELMMKPINNSTSVCSRSWTKEEVRALSGINGSMRRELMMKPINNLFEVFAPGPGQRKKCRKLLAA